MERHRVADWKSIVKEFMEHYKSNEELKITRKHLEMAKQRDTENVSDFITQWRELASEMIGRIPRKSN